jgi:hypothetical protein
MAQVDANWVVPSANPINAPPGVSTVSAGTGITITGTAQNPVISSASGSGAVQSVEGLVGAIDLFGSGLAITTSGQTITLTSAVSTLIAGSNCSISESPPGTFTINNTLSTAAGTITRTVFPVNSAPSSVSLNGDAIWSIAPLYGPTIDPAKNSSVLFVVRMSGVGTKVQAPLTSNVMRAGLYGPTTELVVYDSGLNQNINVNWGNSIFENGNYTVSGTVPIATYTANQFGGLFLGWGIVFPYNSLPYYTFTNMQMKLEMYYIV